MAAFVWSDTVNLTNVFAKPQIISGSYDRCYRYLFADASQFLQKFHSQRHDEDVQITPWILAPNSTDDEVYARVITASIKVPNIHVPGIPPYTKLIECQQLTKAPDSCVLLTSASTPDVPYGTTFRLQAKISIAAVNKDACKLQIGVGVHFIDKPWILGGTIERQTLASAKDGYVEWFRIARQVVSIGSEPKIIAKSETVEEHAFSRQDSPLYKVASTSLDIAEFVKTKSLEESTNTEENADTPTESVPKPVVEEPQPVPKVVQPTTVTKDLVADTQTKPKHPKQPKQRTVVPPLSNSKQVFTRETRKQTLTHKQISLPDNSTKPDKDIATAAYNKGRLDQLEKEVAHLRELTLSKTNNNQGFLSSTTNQRLIFGTIALWAFTMLMINFIVLIMLARG